MTKIEEILDKHVGINILKPYPNLIDAFEEYASYVLSIAAEKVELTADSDMWSDVDKDSILNCLKD